MKRLRLTRLATFASRLIAAALLGAIALLAAASLIGLAGGRSAVVITSGSMAPTIATGSLAVTAPVEPADISVGDIVTVQTANDVLLTHRVNQLIESDGVLLIETRGDANELPDPQPVVTQQLIGRVEFSLPLLGYLIAALRSPLAILLILGLALLAGALHRGAKPATVVQGHPLRVRLAAPVVGALGCLILFGAVQQSVALFNAQAAASGNVFVVANVEISAARTSLSGTYVGMLPGDEAYAQFNVANNGNTAMRYAISTSASNPDGKNLRNQLELTIRAKDASACSAQSGALLAGPMTLSSAALGSSAPGSQAGDRTLNIGSNESLCFTVRLTPDAPAGASAASTTAVFTFAAEQTGNNP